MRFGKVKFGSIEIDGRTYGYDVVSKGGDGETAPAWP
jgi:hypothetical protein